MSIGKASDFRVHDQAAGDAIAKRPADSSYITLSSDTIADDALIGDVLGTLSITASYAGTPRWEIVGHSNFAVNATTGVVTVAHALTAGSDSFKVKLRGTTPQINSPTFSFTVDTGGGGGVPEWVPTNAKIYIDLVNDRAWTEAAGLVAINTLLGTDANTENGWAATSYDANNLTADGYLSGFDLALIGSVRTKVLDEATVVVRLRQKADNPNFSFVLVAADGNDAIELDVGAGSAGGNRYLDASAWGGGSLNINEHGVPVNYLEAGGPYNAFALTITQTRVDEAVNGSAAFSGVVDATDRPAGNPLVAVVLDGGTTFALQSITIYDALPSTVGLSALSETGVTNTAPHDLVCYAVPPLATHTSATQITFAGYVVPSNNDIFYVTVTDDEGNPTTWSVDDPSFSVSNDIVTRNSNLTIGVYSITLRATDPGGLYVEQEFTITVTA